MVDEIKKDNIDEKNDTPMDNGDDVKVEENKTEEKTAEVSDNVEEKKEIETEDIKVEEIKADNVKTEEVKTEDVKGEIKTEEKKEGETEPKKVESKFGDKPRFNKRPDFKKNFRKRVFGAREKPEFEQKILSLRRVTRVMAGGRRFSFSVSVVVGDKKTRVGLGMGKSSDTTLAIEKAVRNAKKNMVKVNLTEKGTIKYDVSGKYKSSEVIIRPVEGKGLAAGGAVRTILEFAGAKEAGAKILSRSKNHINNAKATLVALEPFLTKVEVSLKAPEKNNKRNFKSRRFGNKKPFERKTFNSPKTTDTTIKKDVKVEETK